MYLKHIRAKNYRAFGDGITAPTLAWELNPDTFVRTGTNGTGSEVGYAVRELVRATYLKPLRDAEAELRPGRQSRLSQILGAHNSIAGQEQNDFDKTSPQDIPERLVGLMAFAQHHLGEHEVVKGVERDINDNYLSQFAFTGDALQSRIRIAPDLSLTPILEKFELSLLPGTHIHPDARCTRGLGYRRGHRNSKDRHDSRNRHTACCGRYCCWLGSGSNG